MLTVTLDTNCADDSELVALMRECGAQIALVTTTDREARGTSFKVVFEGIDRVSEPGLWGEGGWGTSMWGGGPVVDYRDENGNAVKGHPFEAILTVVSNCSFPPRGKRDKLTVGQRQQLRDAMILCAHVQHRRSIFVSNDVRAFIKGGRQEKLQSMFDIRIMAATEAHAYFQSLRSAK